VFKLFLPLVLLITSLAVAGCGNGDTAPQGTATAGPSGGATAGPGLSTPELVARLRPSVVQISTEVGAGTGFILDSQGNIVTNNHVVTLPNNCNTPARSINVTLSDDREFTARIVGRDVPTDVAVIKIDASNLTAVSLGSSAALQVGEDVVAIGNALDLAGGPTVTKGVVSAKDRLIEESGQGCDVTIPGAIQTDASINPGNSGGPLVGSNGQVVGITTAVIRGLLEEGIGLAIPIDAVKPIVDELIASGRVERGFLGVGGLFDVTPAIARSLNLPVERGVSFNQVVVGGPAERAGLLARDVIVRVGNRQIRNSGDLFVALSENRAGATVMVQFHRNAAQPREVEVTLAQQA